MTAGPPTVPAESLDTMTSCDTPSVDVIVMGNETIITSQALNQMESVDGVDCADPASKARSLCDAIPVHVMADMLNTAYDIDEPWLGGADSTVIETGGQYNCMYRIDYANATAAGRGSAGNPALWQVDFFPVASGRTPSAEEQEQGCRDLGNEPRTTDGITMCASPGLVDAFIGYTTDGNWAIRIAFDALVLLETAQDKFPPEVLLDMAEQIAPYLPSAGTLATQPCYEDHRFCRGEAPANAQ